MKRKVFISHRNDDVGILVSGILNERLQTAGFDTSFDKVALQGGMNWRETILGDLRTSDVLLLVINEKTVESDWIQRELDTARALNIVILPVVVGNDYDSVKATFERNELGFLQFVVFDVNKQPPDITQIANRIEPLSLETIEAQKQAWSAWRHQRRHKGLIKENPAAITLTHDEIDGVTFCIATGDATALKGYEVLVNTENSYMQMARFFENNTLSWAIRRNGAYRRGERVLEDTVQDALYRQAQFDYGSLPVNDREVIPTLAGHPQSDIAKVTDYRYIFHVASVRVSLAERKYEALPVEDNERIIENCLERVVYVDDAKGAVIYDANGELNQPDENYEAIASILFPIFGAGDGGNELSASAAEIIKGLVRNVPRYQDRGLTVEKIGLSIYSQDDVPEITRAFERNGFQVTATTLD